METSALESSSGQGQPDSSDTIEFDTSSGISLEEQREILAGINAMSAGNPLASGPAGMKAKKRGFLFPLFVNIAAVVLLGLGVVLLSLLHEENEQSIRDSSTTLGLTERKLIQEIRRETSRQIDEKENEINGILTKLSEADAEYRQLQVSAENNLTEAQKERAAALLVMQEEYRGTLSALEDERSRIIEDSRRQEAILRAQAEERAGELSSRIEQTQADLGAAMEELRRLSGEREKALMAEDQMTGYYAAVNSQIDAGLLDEASNTLAAMKEFLDAPSLRGIRSVEAGKQTHLAAVAAMEGMIAEARRFREEAAASGGTVGAAAIAALEQKIKDQEQTIAAYSSGGSEQNAIITENARIIDELRTADAGQQQKLGEQEEEIGTLKSQTETLNSQIAGLNARYQTAIEAASRNEAELNTRIQNSNNEISELSRQAEAREQLLNSMPEVVEQAIESPEVQNLLGPVARQEIIPIIQQAVQRATSEN